MFYYVVKKKKKNFFFIIKEKYPNIQNLPINYRSSLNIVNLKLKVWKP